MSYFWYQTLLKCFGINFILSFFFTIPCGAQEYSVQAYKMVKQGIGKKSEYSTIKVYTGGEIDGKLNNMDSIMKSLISTAKTEAINSSVSKSEEKLSAKLTEIENKRTEDFKDIESRLLQAVQNMDQRILADEVMKNMREQIKAEVLAELKAEKEIRK